METSKQLVSFVSGGHNKADDVRSAHTAWVRGMLLEITKSINLQHYF